MYYISVKLIEETNCLDMTSCSKDDVKKLVQKLDCHSIDLTTHEKSILSNIIYPEDISCSFESIGGHEDIKQQLEKVLFKPLKMNLKEPLFSPPNGIILHGSPGTGKTMFAKAIAKKLDGVFISCSPSLFENKYYGESTKLIKALFSFANKVEPCVIFIDEIDGILGNRNDFDQSLVNEVKTIFLSEMDGIIQRKPTVVFIGATNKLYSIDKAVKRRMRLHIEVPLPDEDARKSILNLHLGRYKLELDAILKDTEGFSGSDLFELCKLAGLEAISQERKNIVLEDVKTAVKLLSTSCS
jgi:ATP-dependent 26S proteasome regulatory subunit